MGSLAFFGGAIAIALGALSLIVPLSTQALFQILFALMVIIGVIVSIAGLVGVFRGLTLQKDNPLAYMVGKVLERFLDNSYTYLRNVNKRRVGYIDAVLVGPPGVLVFRIVDYTGMWINERAEWVNRTNDKLRPAKTNPTRECVHDIYALRKFLKRHGLERVPVYGIVVFTEENVRLEAEGPVVPVCEAHTVYKVMSRNYLKDERITPPTISATVDAIIDG